MMAAIKEEEHTNVELRETENMTVELKEHDELEIELEETKNTIDETMKTVKKDVNTRESKEMENKLEKSEYMMSEQEKKGRAKLELSNQKQKIRIEKFDANEKNQCDELQKLAKKQMEEWYKADNERIAIAKDINKHSWDHYVAAPDEIEPGTEWNRILELCDLNNRKCLNKNKNERMKQVIRKLNKTPLKKPITRPRD